MFNNRSLKMSFVKEPTTEVENTDFNDKVVVLAVMVEGIIKRATIGAVAYLAADTIRKVILIKAEKSV